MALSSGDSGSSFPTVEGYTLTEQIYEGSRTLVYKAISAEQQPVVIKLQRQPYPSFRDVIHFRNQYSIAKRLPISGIIRPLRLTPWRNSYALVMEDFGGESLATYKPQGQPLPLVEALSVAAQLAETLHALCLHQVVHKDIKPANILIHPVSKQVKLTDFSIASLLPKERKEGQNPSELEGTLAYLAPEQTGRMNRGIDYRTDFYSLGVTLYELIAGQVPFSASDPLALVHCHIAEQPTPLEQVRTDLPSAVAQIVLKLMAKNAEDRYQSAWGLKYDLEKCLYQLKETGEIAEFELGQRDISDRFLIPEKLYGRDHEVERLLAAFDRASQGKAELMLVAGLSGIGKTAVISEVHKPITRQQGYFSKGKFDQFNRNLPFSAFVQALRHLMGQLLSESDTQLQRWRTRILQAVGDSGQVIVNVIPELVSIIGQQPAVVPLLGKAAQNRFSRLLRQFILAFASVDHPLVIFLDDLQWADVASLSLMQQLLSQGDTQHLLILGAYRDNEVSPAHPLMLTLDAIAKAGAPSSTLTLRPLALSDLNALVAETLSAEQHIAQPLTDIVAQKTEGNPFFATQFLKSLHADGHIAFEPNLGYWQCDITQIKQLSLTDSVIDLMVMQLQKLPPATQETLKLAACIGAQFDLDTLAIIVEQSQQRVADSLWCALQESLILPVTEAYKFFQPEEAAAESSECLSAKPASITYKFLHDRVQQAAYSLIPPVQKQQYHLQIGRRLLQHIPAAQQHEKLFDIVSQLNAGRSLIVDDAEKEALATLNVRAGQRAIATTAYDTATRCLQAAAELLRADSWRTQYALTLRCYTARIEAAYLSSDLTAMEAYFEQVVQQVRTSLDATRAYEIKIDAYTNRGQLAEALAAGLEFLASFGLTFPQMPSQDDFSTGLAETQRLIADRSVDEIVALPAMTDAESQALLRILVCISVPAYLTHPDLHPLLTFKQVQLSLSEGNAPASTHGYGGYGLLIGAVTGDYQTSYQLGQVAVRIIEKFEDKEYLANTNVVVYHFIFHWKEDLSTTLEPLKQAYITGLEIGDLAYAGYAAYIYGLHAYFAGCELSALATEIDAYGRGIERIGQQTALRYNRLIQQVVLNLIEPTDYPDQLSGQYFDESVDAVALVEDSDYTGLWHFHTFKTALCYLFESYEEAIAHAKQAKAFLRSGSSMVHVPILCLYEALALLAGASEENLTDNDSTNHSEINHNETEASNTQTSQRQLIAEAKEKLANWASHCANNIQHKFDLLCAEELRVLGDRFQAADFYDRAIAGAKANGFASEEALANELAAKFYLAWGKEKVAAGYMQEAYYGYTRWGAGAKIEQLEQRYSSLLKPILQPVSQTIDAFNTFETIFTAELSVHRRNHSTDSTSQASSLGSSRINKQSITHTLDLAAVLKASQILSRNIELDDLLRQLTMLILQNSGGDRCALILPAETGEWRVSAIATLQQTQLCATPLDTTLELPIKLIQYVKNTQKVVVIDNLDTNLSVIGEYLIENHPKSVLCAPLLSQGQLKGILYLSNQPTSGAFTKDRILILDFLCTQAAISLENARLYQQVQQALTDLQQAQLTIVRSEKMSALGALVAGVAHEINNPVGCILGNVGAARDYVSDLLNLLDLYAEQFPNPGEEIEEELESMNLAYIREDLPKLIRAMKDSGDRIRSISKSLRTFSRADTDYKQPFDIKEGLNSTVLILRHRLKANEQRPEIEVVTQYADISPIECFPGQLNQVFMNILANAIDALDEASETQSAHQIKANPQRITIQTTLVANHVKVTFSDNGPGMPETVRSQIFNHLFTTKKVGKGTGLGLAIAQQIIVEAHSGTIEVRSEEGKGTEFCIRLPI